jgi:hypothetical protein
MDTTNLKSLFYHCHHGIWGGFHVLHPSEYVAPKGKFVVKWGIGELGLRAVKDGTNYIYPFMIDSHFKNAAMSVTLLVEAFGINLNNPKNPAALGNKAPIYTSTKTISNATPKFSFDIPPCTYISVTITNPLTIAIVDSIIKPILIYTA